MRLSVTESIVPAFSSQWRRTQRLGVLLAAIAALSFPSAAFPGNKVAFIKGQMGGTWSLWTSDPAGAIPVELVGTTGARWPNVSPQGREIVYGTSNSNLLHLINVDGTNSRTIDAGAVASNPQWAPDGQTIIFQRSSGSESAIYAIRKDGSGLRLVVDRAGRDENPAYSPTGNHIAWESNDVGGRSQIFTARPDGTDILQLTDAGAFGDIAFDPAFSPDGTSIVYTADTGFPTITRINLDGTGKMELAYAYAGGKPTWSPDGQTVLYVNWTDSGSGEYPEIRSVPAQGGVDQPFLTSFYPTFHDDPSYVQKPDYRELLSRYVPELRYDAQETYRADAANMITDNYLTSPSGYTNRLWDDTGTYVIAAADPSDPADDLALDYLGATYPSGRAALDGDSIDEENSYAADAQRLHTYEQYAHRSYGRVVGTSNGEAILQYWFFFYYNPRTYFGFGAHEGDLGDGPGSPRLEWRSRPRNLRSARWR
jgi:WD40-like Beta Propeller Repeat